MTWCRMPSSFTNEKCLATKHHQTLFHDQTCECWSEWPYGWTCLIKHRSNNWYKPPSKRGTHARIKHVSYGAFQTNKTSPIKIENKRHVLSFWSNVWWPSKFFKHDQTAPTKVAKRLNIWSPNNIWWCLVAKHFPFGQGLSFTCLDAWKKGLLHNKYYNELKRVKRYFTI